MQTVKLNDIMEEKKSFDQKNVGKLLAVSLLGILTVSLVIMTGMYAYYYQAYINLLATQGSQPNIVSSEPMSYPSLKIRSTN